MATWIYIPDEDLLVIPTGPLPFLRLADTFGTYAREVTYAVEEYTSWPLWLDVLADARYTPRYWRLNTQPGSFLDYTLYDDGLHTNRVNGTYTPTGVTWGVLPGSTQDGDFAISVSGGSGHIPAIPRDPAHPTAFSFSFGLNNYVLAVRCAAGGPGGTVLFLAVPGSPPVPVLQLRVTATGTLTLTAWTGQSLTTAVSVADGAWHQLMLLVRVGASTDLALAVDGAVVAGWLPLTSSSPPAGDKDVWLGAAAGSDPFTGSLDEFVQFPTGGEMPDYLRARLYGAWRQAGQGLQLRQYWVSPGQHYTGGSYGGYWTQEATNPAQDSNYYVRRDGRSGLYGAIPDYATINASPPPVPAPTNYSVAAGIFDPTTAQITPTWTVPLQETHPPNNGVALSLGQGIRWGGVQSVALDPTGAGMYVIPINSLSVQSRWNPLLHWDGTSATASTTLNPRYYDWARVKVSPANPYAISILDACFTFIPGTPAPGHWEGYATDPSQPVTLGAPPYMVLARGLRSVFYHAGSLFGLAEGNYAASAGVSTAFTAVLAPASGSDPLVPASWRVVRVLAPDNLAAPRNGTPWAPPSNFLSVLARRCARLALVGGDVFWTTDLIVSAPTGASPSDATCVWRMSGAGHTISASFALPAPTTGNVIASGGLIPYAGELYFWTWQQQASNAFANRALRVYRYTGADTWTLLATDTTGGDFGSTGEYFRSVIGTQGELIWLWARGAGFTPFLLRYHLSAGTWQRSALLEDDGEADGMTIFFAGDPP